LADLTWCSSAVPAPARDRRSGCPPRHADAAGLERGADRRVARRRRREHRTCAAGSGDALEQELRRLDQRAARPQQPVRHRDDQDELDVLRNQGRQCELGRPEDRLQQWQAVNGQLVNPATGKCLDDFQSNTTNGTQLVLWDCNGGSNQQWRLP
jgi:hypothetical protein